MDLEATSSSLTNNIYNVNTVTVQEGKWRHGSADPAAPLIHGGVDAQSEDGVHPVPHATPALPLGVKLTGYRLLGLLFLVATLSKFTILHASPPRPITTNSLDLVFGGLLAIALWCLGWYESADPPIWRPFFHVDYSRQAIATIIFLGRVIIIAALWFGHQVAVVEFTRSLFDISLLLGLSVLMAAEAVVVLGTGISWLLFIRSSSYRRASRTWPLSLVIKAMFSLVGSDPFERLATIPGVSLGMTTYIIYTALATHPSTTISSDHGT